MQYKTLTIGRKYRHLNRYLEILKVLIKYGFEDLISLSPLRNFISLGRKITLKKVDPSIHTLSKWERVRMMLEDLGPTFIKLGQIMSIRPDLVPLDLINELKKLQDSVPPFPVTKAKEIIEIEFGKTINEIFQDFHDTPIAAASLSQVHKAVLKEGDIVAVKVQRPGIYSKIETDLEIMYNIAYLLEKHIDEIRYFNLTKIVEEFDKAIHKELNFLNEATNIERFVSNFKNDQRIYVPKIYRNYCTSKILIMEYIEGIKISEINKFENINIDKKLLIKRGGDIILKQIFEHRFFHADPHPGNIFVLPGNIICFIDYGMMGTLTQTTKNLIISVVSGIISNDINKIIRSTIKLCEPKGDINLKKLESNLTDLIDKYYYKSLYQIDISEIVNDLIKFFPENNIKLPSDLYSLGKTLLILQALGQILDPEYNIAKEIEPYIKKLLKEEFSIKNIKKDLITYFEGFIELAKILPFETQEIIEKIKSGKIKLDIEHKELNHLVQSNERISNRITIAIILASIIIGSSLIIHSGIPPLWNNIPVIGLFGYILAIIISFLLIISIFRHGKI